MREAEMFYERNVYLNIQKYNDIVFVDVTTNLIYVAFQVSTKQNTTVTLQNHKPK